MLKTFCLAVLLAPLASGQCSSSVTFVGIVADIIMQYGTYVQDIDAHAQKYYPSECCVIRQNCSLVVDWINYAKKNLKVEPVKLHKYFWKFFSLLYLGCQCWHKDAIQSPTTAVNIITTSTKPTTAKQTTMKPTTVKPPFHSTCGVSLISPALKAHLQITSRIVGGVVARPCEYPWMVYLSIGKYTCGGALIDKKHVLTAAHCITTTDITAYIGAHNTPFDQKGVKVININSHGEYSKRTFLNDIAILELQEEVTFSECIAPICLPESGQSVPPVGTKCIAAGWGVLEELGNSPTALRKVVLPVVSNQICQNRYSFYFQNGKNFCAGFTDASKDTCQGDSGGPLMCPSNGRWHLSGIVSSGNGCATLGFPGLYTNTAEYVGWIKANMRNI